MISFLRRWYFRRKTKDLPGTVWVLNDDPHLIPVFVRVKRCTEDYEVVVEVLEEPGRYSPEIPLHLSTFFRIFTHITNHPDTLP